MTDETSTPAEGTPDPALDKLSSGQTHLKQAADDLRAAAETKAAHLRSLAGNKATEFRGKAETALADAKTRARTLQDETETFVRENPAKAVLYALGIGFVLGLIIRR